MVLPYGMALIRPFGVDGLCVGTLRCQWVRFAVVPTSPIDPTARGSSNYGGRGDPELWGMETHTDCELCCIELWRAEPPGSMIVPGPRGPPPWNARACGVRERVRVERVWAPRGDFQTGLKPPPVSYYRPP